MADWDWKYELSLFGYTALAQLDWDRKRQTYWYRKARGLNDLKIHILIERAKQFQPYKGFSTFNAFIRYRDRHICYLCGGYIAYEQSNIEHKIPVIRGGYTTEENCADSHEACNKEKGTLTDEEYLEKKQRKRI